MKSTDFVERACKTSISNVQTFEIFAIFGPFQKVFIPLLTTKAARKKINSHPKTKTTQHKINLPKRKNKTKITTAHRQTQRRKFLCALLLCTFSRKLRRKSEEKPNPPTQSRHFPSRARPNTKMVLRCVRRPSSENFSREKLSLSSHSHVLFSNSLREIFWSLRHFHPKSPPDFWQSNFNRWTSRKDLPGNRLEQFVKSEDNLPFPLKKSR